MRVLLLTALYPPAIGGAATYFGTIVDHLACCKDIESIDILTERMPGEPQTFVRKKVRIRRWLPNRVSAGQKPLSIHVVTYVLTQLWFVLRFSRLIRRCEIDVIHFHTRYRGYLFHRALRRVDVPVVADLRDKMADPVWLARVADWLLCCGEAVWRFAVEGGFPGERATLIPNAFEPPRVPSPSLVSDACQRYGLKGGPYLLFVGDITHNKGVYDLLEAYQRWKPGHPEVQLVFAGINREGERFLSQVRRTAGATYVGYVPHQDVLTLMRGAKIVTLPSRSEGLPTVILEAIALGTKVVCPPGIPEFERHLPQFVLPEVSVNAIVETLSAVWQSDSLPLYPFDEHRVHRVIEALAGVYSGLVSREHL
jgi:glycosyltransferase involved in cell wall biosynthesis